MKIYTKTGDSGTSSLYDGNRLKKDSIFFEVLGSIDELSSHIGMLCSLINNEQVHLQLRQIQRVLQNIGSEIATVNREGRIILIIDQEETQNLEKSIDTMEKTNTPLTTFILPGIKQDDAQAHICRSVTRRVERLLWKMEDSKKKINGKKRIINMEEYNVNDNILKFMNRLSDYFFVLARYLCVIRGDTDYVS